jgi:hypothetical protein
MFSPKRETIGRELVGCSTGRSSGFAPRKDYLNAHELKKLLIVVHACGIWRWLTAGWRQLGLIVPRPR